jgi:hypothetical protein
MELPIKRLTCSLQIANKCKPQKCIRSKLIAEINLAKSINRISDLNTKVQTTGSHICEECLTSFDSEQALQEHFEYSKYRRKGACWL